MRSRCLLPWTTLHSDSEHVDSTVDNKSVSYRQKNRYLFLTGTVQRDVTVILFFLHMWIGDDINCFRF
jgi:hypothetical protein